MSKKRRKLNKNETAKVFERDGEQCQYCGTLEGPFEVDHVYPYSKGGETSVENSAIACKKCNRKKYNRIGTWPKAINSKKEYVRYLQSNKPSEWRKIFWSTVISALLSSVLLAWRVFTELALDDPNWNYLALLSVLWFTMFFVINILVSDYKDWLKFGDIVYER